MRNLIDGCTTPSEIASPAACDWAYLAGLFDGEGCIKTAFKTYTTGNRRSTWQLSLDICNTHRPVIEWVQSMFGGFAYTQEREEAHVRRRFHWASRSGAGCLFVLRGILPYLRIKREQAELAIDFLETVNPRFCKGVILTDDDLKMRQDLVFQLRESRWKEWDAFPKEERHPKSCLNCGEEFMPSTKDSKHCSRRCLGAYSQRARRAQLRRQA